MMIVAMVTDVWANRPRGTRAYGPVYKGEICLQNIHQNTHEQKYEEQA